MKSENKLRTLASRANEAHGSVQSHLRKAIHHAKEAGDALRTAKQRVGHGNWLKWLKENFDASAETAGVYMRRPPFEIEHVVSNLTRSFRQ